MVPTWSVQVGEARTSPRQEGSIILKFTRLRLHTLPLYRGFWCIRQDGTMPPNNLNDWARFHSLCTFVEGRSLCGFLSRGWLMSWPKLLLAREGRSDESCEHKMRLIAGVNKCKLWVLRHHSRSTYMDLSAYSPWATWVTASPVIP